MRDTKYGFDNVKKIGELLDRYLRHSKSELAYSVWKNYKTSILNILIPEFGAPPLASKLKQSHIQDWKAKYSSLDKPIVNKTLYNILCPLYNVMDEALHNEIIDKNFFNNWRPRIKKELKVDEDVNPFTLDEALLSLISQKNFTFEENDRVFHHPKNIIPWKTDKQIRESYWKPILKAADVEYRKACQTRHTYASILLTTGVDPSYVAKLMGHAYSSSIRKHYARWIRGIDNQLEGKINAFLLLNGHKES